MSAPGVATSESLPVVESCNITQWFYFDWIEGNTHNDATTPDGKEWGSLLEMLNSQEGCKAVVWATVVEDPSKGWLMIDWPNKSDLDRFQDSEAHLSLIQHLARFAEGSPEIRTVPFPRGLWWIPYGPKYYAELVYFFFPADLLADAKEKISCCHGLVPWGVGDGTTPERGHYTETRGWMLQTVNWQGQEALVYVFKILWTGSDGETIFKEQWRELEDCPDGPLAIDRLWERMETLGTLGREQYHGNFLSKV